MPWNFASRLFVLLIQIWSCTSQICDYAMDPNQTLLGGTTIHVSVECNDTSYVGVSWSTTVPQQQINTLTLLYACSDPFVQGVLLYRSNQFNGRKTLPDGAYFGMTCSVWGCFEWNNPHFMYPNIEIGNKSCTTPALSHMEVSPSLQHLYSQTASAMNSAVASVLSNFASPIASSLDAVPRLVVALAVVLTTCTLIAILSTAVVAFLYWKRARMASSPLLIDCSTVVDVDTMPPVDVQSINSDNASFCPLNYSKSSSTSSSTQSTSIGTGKYPAMLYFDHPDRQQSDDQCSSLDDVSYCHFIMVRALQMDGYINSDVKINDSCAQKHQTILTENTYL